MNILGKYYFKDDQTWQQYEVILLEYIDLITYILGVNDVIELKVQIFIYQIS